ncbi:asparagine synthase (glutamine-hydrolyzing) [Candidatus Pacearchaeota archaeon]|nr:asparagine synthase (glutamine-hydrolyzing) [Candidatus Pacearchaeota archaeon]
MCGINGFNFIDKKVLSGMNDSLKHRGPDDEGEFYDSKNKISLGHRRLAILDLSEKGHQPMEYSHKGKKATIVFNGEIYNFQEIKKDLVSLGYKFNSKSDTEVILASYLEWGFDCVKKFNGMWAFCIFDLSKKILFLSRDRIGKKPLYYFWDNNKFIFSSEIKGILKHGLKLNLNKEAVNLYLSLGFIPSPYSIYQKVYKLEQRQNLIFDLKGRKIDKFYYYEWPKYNPIYNKKELIEEGKRLIEDAIRLRLISDVPVGAFLSGGLDSSAIVAEMNKFVKKDLITYSIGFKDGNDETKYIKIINDLFKLKNNHDYFDEKVFEEELKNIFYYYDEPFADYSMFPTFLLCKNASKKIKVSLSGDGGDEIFGGYPKYQKTSQLTFMRKFPKIIRLIFYRLMKNVNLHKLRDVKEGLRLSLIPLEKIYSEIRGDIYKSKEYKKFVEPRFIDCLKDSGGNLSEAIRLFDLKFNTMSENYLLKTDRASMANSLEVRSPFLDYRLMEYSFKIPAELKASKFETKKLMKEILKDTLPKTILKRKKAGFSPPIDEWINKKKYVKEIKKGLDVLYRNKIIDKKWLEFYNEEVFKNNSIVYQNCKIRLFLLYKWFEYWGILR